ncbi:MAG: DEAD/DEAH box helicase [Deltaproteobacteria bacterium]|nr:DEAD/DEAH box helicase [Deltaproteobacteria bacterium]
MVNQRKYHRRSGEAWPRRRPSPTQEEPYKSPRADPHLKPFFKKIGVPKPRPFKPDPFQVEALEQIKTSDVLVSAPTGAGKTWIASQTIRQYLSNGLRAWYASPLKALSNSIYQELSREFGSESCGILTGDRKENADAPIIVGTTEILRNQLYDAMHTGKTIRSDLVILDEAHYLSDPDRGVVWEEVLIYLPPRVRLLLLSATVSNAEEIASWLEENRGTQTRVVRSDDRPVPLEMLFLFPDGYVSPLGGKRGLAPRVKKYISSREGKRRGSRQIQFGEIIYCLRAFDLLPAIFFLKSRKDCNHALLTCPSVERPSELRGRAEREVKEFMQEYPHLRGHPQLSRLLDAAVGSHHAGQLPYWKMLIERMMNKGYLEVIFSTSTVAAGVNFPARTVVLVQSDRYDGHEFTNLTATDLHQMIGRAGRRGKDHIGFALIVPGLHQDPELIHELRDSPPEPLMSQIHINFSMTLNLLLSHTPMEVKDLLDRSFAAFQEKKAGSPAQRRWGEMLKVLNNALPRGVCNTGDPYEILENIEKRLETKKEKRVMTREIRNERRLKTYTPFLRPGRLFLHKNKGVYVIFHTYKDEGRLICAAQNIQETVRARKRKIRLRKVSFDKIRALYDYRVDLPEGYSLERLQALFDAIRREDLELLHVDAYEETAEEELDLIQKRLSDLPCERCEHLNECHTAKNKKLKRILKEFRSLAYKMEGDKGGLWASFKRHLRFLKEMGFVDEMDRLTPDGDWASKLRLDQPLLIAEAIRKKALTGISPEVMAGCIAPFVWDRVQEVEFQTRSPMDLTDCEDAFHNVIESIQEIRRLKVKRGFESPPILFWPAAALFLWAKGVPWESLLSYIPVDEGDMASLILRTADHLRQATDLKKSHPELVSVAHTAIVRILREPVLIS